MDIVNRFGTILPSKDEKILQDVRDYIDWETNSGEYEFNPNNSDDVSIRTYLLDCRTRGIGRKDLNRIASSLRKFYAWLKANLFVVENPFDKFNLNHPFLDRKLNWFRHDAFPGLPEEREMAHLRALNRLAESTNQASDVQSMLAMTLETLLGVTDLKTGWISIKADSGLLNQALVPPSQHGFILAAAHNLPPSLEKSNHYYLTRPPECHCQMLLRTGRLRRGVNVVECSRLQDARAGGDKNNGLVFHASLPIVFHDQPIGIMNFAAEEWRLLSKSDLQFLTAGARQFGAALERAYLYDLNKTHSARLEHELDMARKVQVSLFPDTLPEIDGYTLAAFWQPANETSGDYYNVFKLPDDRWGFIVADVCGKGAPAALYMAMTHGFIRERVESEPSPAALLSQVNRMLCEQDLEMQFVTSFYAVLDTITGTLKYALAGHPPPFLRRTSGEVEKIDGRGIALGVSPVAEYKDMSLTLAPGESLVAFTDGVTDASNLSRESYELSNLKTTIGSAPAQAPDLLKHLQRTLNGWVKEAPNYDDITLLVIGRKIQ